MGNLPSLTSAEENYLKCIYHLSGGGKMLVSTNGIAAEIQTKPASVTDMLKKLQKKQVIDYYKYKGVNITRSGKLVALLIIRKHRLWEVFLVEKLGFHWDEVEEIAEQLEHIRSINLINKLDHFLGYPRVDPHGDPIPNEDGIIESKPKILLAKLTQDKEARFISVKNTSPIFLQYLDKLGLHLGSDLKVLDRNEFDHSLQIMINQGSTIFISRDVAENILVSEQ
ncbi:MAG: metal-dependent transcriptional regulator [Cyclobacteriaceae bacterium]|nr:metal-dependent transcriptional regulator [Cyclobacteriaceae bacterium]MCH8515242.1 metal-dependent transcriptional regulator [Cyclobacteriaceae bacterium]